MERDQRRFVEAALRFRRQFQVSRSNMAAVVQLLKICVVTHQDAQIRDSMLALASMFGRGCVLAHLLNHLVGSLSVQEKMFLTNVGFILAVASRSKPVTLVILASFVSMLTSGSKLFPIRLMDWIFDEFFGVKLSSRTLLSMLLRSAVLTVALVAVFSLLTDAWIYLGSRGYQAEAKTLSSRFMELLRPLRDSLQQLKTCCERLDLRPEALLRVEVYMEQTASITYLFSVRNQEENIEEVSKGAEHLLKELTVLTRIYH